MSIWVYINNTMKLSGLSRSYYHVQHEDPELDTENQEAGPKTCFML